MILNDRLVMKLMRKNHECVERFIPEFLLLLKDSVEFGYEYEMTEQERKQIEYNVISSLDLIGQLQSKYQSKSQLYRMIVGEDAVGNHELSPETEEMMERLNHLFEDGDYTSEMHRNQCLTKLASIKGFYTVNQEQGQEQEYEGEQGKEGKQQTRSTGEVFYRSNSKQTKPWIGEGVRLVFTG